MADDLRDLGFTVSQTEDQSTRVCSPCSSQVRSARAGFSCILKPAFKKASTMMIALGFKKNRMFASPQGSAARFMQWLNFANLIIDNTLYMVTQLQFHVLFSSFEFHYRKQLLN